MIMINGSEETACIEQAVGKHLEILTVNGWGGGGGVGEWGDECSVNGGNGERLMSKRSSTFS